MPFNLYPYNQYCLYATFVLVLIFLIVTLAHAGKLKKAIGAHEDTLTHIKASLAEVETKANAIKQEAEAKKKKNKLLFTILPIAYAVYQTYKNDEQLQGIKGYRKATARVLQKRSYPFPKSF